MDVYNKLLVTYREFVKGDSDECPTHDGPLEEETESIVSHLVKLNELRLLTFDSQPGRSEVSSYGETESQRAYLEYYIETELWAKIELQLLTTDLVYFNQPASDKSELVKSVPVSFVEYEGGRYRFAYLL